MRPTPRSDAVGAFYAENAADLHRAIRRAISGPDALIEDACAYAWMQLLRYGQVTFDEEGFRWLYVVAIREAYRLSDRGRREVAAGAPTELPLSVAARSAGGEAEDRERFRDGVALLGGLRGRQARMVFLHASGFNYEEIAAITGDTPRTVERQLLRGKRALQRETQEQVA